MRRNKKLDYHKRNLRRWFDRHYKGLSDLLAILLFVAGIFTFSTGTFLALIGNYTSVLDMAIGFMLLMGSSDLWQYGRRKHG